jgi:hypothetical protein
VAKKDSKDYLVHIGSAISLEKRQLLDDYVAKHNYTIRKAIELAIDLLVAQK